MLELVLNFLFPQVCIICGKLNKYYICENCERRFIQYRKYNLIDNQKLIQNKLNKQIRVRCYEIDNQILYWDKMMYIFDYKGIVRKTILEYKFGEKSYLSNFFVYEILKGKKVYEILNFCDIIIPVPMYKRKMQERGYNQTELITKILQEKSGIKEEKILFKIKNTKTQSLLEINERKQNVEGSFCIKNPELVKNKRVIIFDDIFTTGATINEISKILKETGAKEIFVLVIAKD